MTTCYGVSLENVVECMQNIYPPYLLCILKGALCEQHILVGAKQSVMREGHTRRQLVPCSCSAMQTGVSGGE